MPSFEVCK